MKISPMRHSLEHVIIDASRRLALSCCCDPPLLVLRHLPLRSHQHGFPFGFARFEIIANRCLSVGEVRVVQKIVNGFTAQTLSGSQTEAEVAPHGENVIAPQASLVELSNPT